MLNQESTIRFRGPKFQRSKVWSIGCTLEAGDEDAFLAAPVQRERCLRVRGLLKAL